MATLPALWLVTAPTAANVVVSSNPTLALKLWPWSAEAAAREASTLAMTGASPAQLTRARRLAWQALQREPVNIPAVRSLALADDLEGRPGAGGLFGYAEQLSRRDLATQLWMIEAFVAKGDVLGALIHYDRALRTRKEAEALLLPILISAVATPATRDPIGRLIATRPQWWPRYVEQALADPAAIDSWPFIFSRLRLSPSEEQSRGFLSTAIAGLIRAGRYDDALTIYRGALRGDKKLNVAPHDGSFEHDPLLPPFDWQLASGDDVSALIQAGVNGRRMLFAAPTEGAKGEVARQLQVLPPGRYRLDYRAGKLTAGGAQLSISLQCTNVREQHDVAVRQLAPAPESGHADTMPFTVPAGGCPAQWLIISIDNPGTVPEALPWIDDLRIKRLPA